MPGAVRLGDVCTGHDTFSPRPNVEGSPNVFVNGKPSHRKGDAWDSHCNSVPVCHGSTAGKGSSTVFVNGKPKCRIDDPVACGGTMATGSGNVFVGGGQL